MKKVSDRFTTYALYTDPPLGRVGMTEKEARGKTDHLLIGKMPMEQVSRAREMGETEGFLKILVNGETKQILGAAFLGVKCDEVVQLIYLAMMMKLPYTELQKMVRIHPTVTEYIPSLLGKLHNFIY
jgi:pyruvate/2-oxoglutarate dehydrogenase complex dihydrolipoamide dehydrogenase (E3) component